MLGWFCRPLGTDWSSLVAQRLPTRPGRLNGALKTTTIGRKATLGG
jgi:hypothetical protein